MQSATFAAVGMVAEGAARIGTMSTMVAVPITDTATMRRLVAFAGDTAELADRCQDLELRELIDGLHTDLLALKGDDDE